MTETEKQLVDVLKAKQKELDTSNKELEATRKEIEILKKELAILKREKRKRTYSLPDHIALKFGGTLGKNKQMYQLPFIYEQNLNALSMAIRRIHFEGKRMEDLTVKEYEQYCSLLESVLAEIYGNKKPPVTATTDGNPLMMKSAERT